MGFSPATLAVLPVRQNDLASPAPSLNLPSHAAYAATDLVFPMAQFRSPALPPHGFFRHVFSTCYMPEKWGGIPGGRAGRPLWNCELRPGSLTARKRQGGRGTKPERPPTTLPAAPA